MITFVIRCLLTMFSIALEFSKICGQATGLAPSLRPEVGTKVEAALDRMATTRLAVEELLELAAVPAPAALLSYHLQIVHLQKIVKMCNSTGRY